MSHQTVFVLAFLAITNNSCKTVKADCVANESLNGVFELELEDDGRVNSIPRFDSCCMFDVCGLPCPEEVSEPSSGYSISLSVSIVIFSLIGASTYLLIRGSAENFFVAGRSLPLFVLTLTLASQAIDGNSLLGNVDLSYKYSFWDGAVIPIGLSLSLFINGLFLAGKVNEDNAMTLPDVFAKRYGVVVEVLVSLTSVISFLMLLAGNLVGMGVIAAYLWGISETGAIWISSAITWSYTVTGGLYSVAYTDVFQSLVGWTGCLALCYWLISNQGDQKAPPPSIGYPGYIYPNTDICDMYQGVPCQVDPTKCCYNEELWCPRGLPDCDRYDRAAYPTGEQWVFEDQMTDFFALSPYPNALPYNWATIFILAFGNLAALDFQSRCMATKSARTARIGCIIGAGLVLFVALPFSFLGSITRIYYGPDAVTSEFSVDSCSLALGLPTCGEWVPDPIAFLKLLTHEVPPVLGALCLIGITAATMSTSDGAILALGTVVSHNILRHLHPMFPGLKVTTSNLLFMARVSTLPLTLISTCIAAYYRSNEEHAAGSTGSLLIVAFDIAFATMVVPLFGAFYAKDPSPRAALISILGGAITRLVLQFTLRKDGSLIFPQDDVTFLDYGPAASAKVPAFMDVNETEIWDPSTEQCDQEPYDDWTGIDSLAAGFASLLLFLAVQTIEKIIAKPLFEFPGGVGYEKEAKSLDADGCKDTANVSIDVIFAITGFFFLVFTIGIVLVKNAL